MNLFPSRKIYTVTGITAEVKTTLESEFSDIFVEGEISNFTAASSGHLYFVLKDKGAQLKCVCFRSRARFFRFKVEDGLQVIAGGSLGIYEPRGEYQLYVESMEPKGLGSLQLAFERLKLRLQEEGLFAPEHKKPLPLLPRCIGIVTSPTGAAIQDILRILRRRHESVQVLIYPAKVQGDGAAQEIAAGIRALNTIAEVDVLIVGRGGGSLEDLWAFNEEAVARAIFDSRVPVISAVGHEIDFTIADFVADLRAPTPSAAAEIVVAQKNEMIAQVQNLRRQLNQSIQFRLSQLRSQVYGLSADRVFLATENKLAFYRQRLDELAFRLEENLQSQLGESKRRCQLLVAGLVRLDLFELIRGKREAVNSCVDKIQVRVRLFVQSVKGRADALEGALQALSPLAVLDRGYAICRDEQGHIIKDARTLQLDDPFSVKLSRGEIGGRVEKLSGPEEP
jgi:exodeoxyribonuclease VII large subunit